MQAIAGGMASNCRPLFSIPMEICNHTVSVPMALYKHSTTDLQPTDDSCGKGCVGTMANEEMETDDLLQGSTGPDGFSTGSSGSGLYLGLVLLIMALGLVWLLRHRRQGCGGAKGRCYGYQQIPENGVHLELQMQAPTTSTVEVEMRNYEASTTSRQLIGDSASSNAQANSLLPLMLTPFNTCQVSQKRTLLGRAS